MSTKITFERNKSFLDSALVPGLLVCCLQPGSWALV
jgi:hypothetical protein